MPPSHPTNPISFLPGRSTAAFPGRREPASPRRGAETGEPAHAGRSLQESGLRARRGEADRNPRVPPSPPLPAPSRRQSPAGEGGGEASPEARSAPARPGPAPPVPGSGTQRRGRGVPSPVAEAPQEAAEPLAAGPGGSGGGRRAGPAHAALFTPVAKATAPAVHRAGPAPEAPPPPRARCRGDGGGVFRRPEAGAGPARGAPPSFFPPSFFFPAFPLSRLPSFLPSRARCVPVRTGTRTGSRGREACY